MKNNNNDILYNAMENQEDFLSKLLIENYKELDTNNETNNNSNNFNNNINNIELKNNASEKNINNYNNNELKKKVKEMSDLLVQSNHYLDISLLQKIF